MRPKHSLVPGKEPLLLLSWALAAVLLWHGQAAFSAEPEPAVEAQTPAITPPVTAKPAGPTETAAQPATAAEEKPAASPELIAQWITDLDSDFYVTRERATEALADAGPVALVPLAAAADGPNLEVATRAVRAMFQISQTQEGKYARPALTVIAKLANRPADKSVAETILGGLREREAMAAIKELGGVVEREYERDGEVVVGQLRIGSDWRGGDEKLSYVADLKSLQILLLIGAPITDKGLEKLHGMTNLVQVQVYNTKATAAGAAKLGQTLPSAEVHYRVGALLGIRGVVGFQGGAVVEAVQPDTAAQAADIRSGDVIKKINGQEVNTFEELTTQIAKYKAGDKAKLELTRPGETEPLVKEVTFGGWE